MYSLVSIMDACLPNNLAAWLPACLPTCLPAGRPATVTVEVVTAATAKVAATVPA